MKLLSYKKIITLLCLLALTLQGLTQRNFRTEFDLPFFLPTGEFQFRSDITTPEDFFGFQIDEQHLSHCQVVAYMQLIASQSPRFKLEVSGRSFQQRPLIFLTITSPENHANLENIRTRHLKLSDPAQSGSLNIEEMPIVIWLGYSVHGNEASATHAAIVMAYFLAAAEGPEIDDILANSVILLQPALNPDGVQRFSTWINSNRSFTPVTNPLHREFNEPAPNSRTNHYWFDLNRDWLLLQMPESQGRTAFYFRWRPTMVNDFHEHGTSANYFFSPGVVTRTHPLIPSTNWEVTRQISEFHARAMEEVGTIFFSREVFDDFYPGRGGCFPDFLGAIGILYEQASSRGFFQERDDGLIQSFAAGIRNQTHVSFSAVRAGIAMRTQLLDYTRNAYREALQMARRDPIQGYVFGSPKTRQIDYKFFQILNQFEIEIFRLARPLTVGDRTFDPNYAYIIPSQQNEYRLLKAIMERTTELPDTLFFDVTAWTLPLAFNLHYAELGNIRGLVGERITEFPEIRGNVLGKSNYAYIFNVNEFYSVRLIYHLQDANIRIQHAVRPFRMIIDGEERFFDYGAVLVPVADQFRTPDEIYAVLQRWAPETGVTVYPVFTSISPDFDLGGRNFRNMRKPKTAIITGGGGHWSGIGTIWHLFDQRLQIPLTLLEYNRVNARSLLRYNTIILHGNYNFSAETLDALRAWYQTGGTLIAVGEGWRTVNQINIPNVRIETIDIEPAQASAQQDNVFLPFVDRHLGNRRGGTRIAGVILESRLDRTSPIGYGILTSTIPSMRETTNIFRAPSPFSVPVSYLANPLMGGFMPYNVLNRVGNTPAVITFPRLAFFVDEPAFRAYWFGTTRMLMNAIFFPL